MSDFNSIESFYSSIIQDLGIALREALDEGIKLAHDYIITEWYSTYTPKEYIRLNLMMDSLKTRYKLMGDTLEAEIYIDEGIHPASNSQPQTFENLHNWFASGGRFGQEHEHVMDFTADNLITNGRAFDIIMNTLKSKGYDFQ